MRLHCDDVAVINSKRLRKQIAGYYSYTHITDCRLKLCLEQCQKKETLLMLRAQSVTTGS